jgi:hypothetical protein
MRSPSNYHTEEKREWQMVLLSFFENFIYSLFWHQSSKPKGTLELTIILAVQVGGDRMEHQSHGPHHIEGFTTQLWVLSFRLHVTECVGSLCLCRVDVQLKWLSISAKMSTSITN